MFSTDEFFNDGATGFTRDDETSERFIPKSVSADGFGDVRGSFFLKAPNGIEASFWAPSPRIWGRGQITYLFIEMVYCSGR